MAAGAGFGGWSGAGIGLKLPCTNFTRVTAFRPHVPIDGLEHVELPIFTWQFHPEGRDRFATKVGLDPDGIDVRLRDDSRRVLAAFCTAACPIPQKK